MRHLLLTITLIIFTLATGCAADEESPSSGYVPRANHSSSMADATDTGASTSDACQGGPVLQVTPGRDLTVPQPVPEIGVDGVAQIQITNVGCGVLAWHYEVEPVEVIFETIHWSVPVRCAGDAEGLARPDHAEPGTIPTGESCVVNVTRSSQDRTGDPRGESGYTWTLVITTNDPAASRYEVAVVAE